MNKDDLEIIPGIKLGKYRLDWDLDTLIRNLPDNYTVWNGCFDFWEVLFDDCKYSIRIRKYDSKITSIQVWDKFRSPLEEHFKGKIKRGSTHEEVELELELEFGEIVGFDDSVYLPQYPGMAFDFDGDDEENDDDDDSWKKYRFSRIYVYRLDEPEDDKTYKNYTCLQKPCPFPKDKVENPHRKSEKGT